MPSSGHFGYCMRMCTTMNEGINFKTTSYYKEKEILTMMPSVCAQLLRNQTGISKSQATHQNKRTSLSCHSHQRRATWTESQGDTRHTHTGSIPQSNSLSPLKLFRSNSTVIHPRNPSTQPQVILSYSEFKASLGNVRLSLKNQTVSSPGHRVL